MGSRDQFDIGLDVNGKRSDTMLTGSIDSYDPDHSVLLSCRFRIV